ncbi:MAG: hypothetical protein R6W31_01430 [Bacteroidales bacterium]
MYESIIPSVDTIPVHWLWFELLLILTFFIHMVLMNFLLGGTLLTVWDLLRGKPVKKASGTLPTLIALTVNFGIPPLLFVQVLYGHLFYSSSVMLAVPWILVVPILIVAYFAAYIFVRKAETAPLWSKGALLVTSVFLLYTAFILVNNNTLAIRPDRWGIYFDHPGGWNLNLGEPTLWPRYLHFVMAALAIGGLGRAIFYHFSRLDPEEKRIEIRGNLKIFGWITLIQLGVGTWFWLTMPENVWKTFMGGSMFATILMAISWIGAFLILHSSFTGRLNLSMFLGGIQVLLMVVIRDLARAAYLDQVFSPSQLENIKEVSPLVAFLIVFVIGLVALYYMITLIFKPKTQQS